MSVLEIHQDYSNPSKCAITPLLKHLEGVRNFSNPFSGTGKLNDLLYEYGFKCYWASDNNPKATGINKAKPDTLTTPLNWSDIIITIPPHKLGIIEKTLKHFRNQNVAWVLLPSSYMLNKNFTKYMKYCSDVVRINSKFCWYKFGFNEVENTKYHL